MSGGTAPGGERREGEPAFEEPWQARAFAIAVSLTDRGGGDLRWEAFRRRLVGEIGAVDAADGEIEGDEAAYYGRWLRALERLLDESGLITASELDERAREFEAGERDASEFVIGEHGDAHEHGRGHPHDH